MSTSENLSSLKSIEQLEQDLQKACAEEKIEIIFRLSKKHGITSPSKTIEICKQGLDLLADYPDDSKLLYFQHQLARACQRLCNYQDSLEYAFKYLHTAEKAGDKDSMASAYNCIGIAYWRLSIIDDAMDNFLKSLELYEELEDKQGVAGLYNNLGILNESLDDIDTAIENYSKALEISREIGDQYDCAGILNNLGVIHLARGNRETAEKLCTESLKIRQEINDLYGVSHSQINLGQVQRELGNYEQALITLECALNTTVEFKDRYAEGEARLHIGLIHKYLNDHEKAVEYIEESIRIARETESGELLEEGIMHLSGVYEKTRNFEKSLELFKQYKETHDKIFDENSRKRINELETRYKVKSKMKEIELIQKKNVELTTTNKELADALNEVKKLSGLLPICSSCKKIRDDQGYWKQIESYISEHSDAQFSHGLCPECTKLLFLEYKEDT